jgi:hypothetical protein
MPHPLPQNLLYRVIHCFLHEILEANIYSVILVARDEQLAQMALLKRGFINLLEKWGGAERLFLPLKFLTASVVYRSGGPGSIPGITRKKK